MNDTPATVQAQTRRQQQVEELCAAALRALTGDPDLHYRGRRLHKGVRALPVHAPHLRVTPETHGFAAYRAVSDAVALRLAHSNADLHARLSPEDPVERLIFELLEQIRVEAMVPDTMPGMAHNLQERFEDWSRQFHHSGLTDSHLGLLLYTIAQICWARVTGKPVLEETEDMMEATRAGIAERVGTPLAGLRRNRLDQAAYIPHALEIARLVAEMMRDATAESGEDDKQEEEEALSAFSLLLDFDSEESDGITAATTGTSKAFEDAEQGYRVYTTRYDVEVNAASLVRAALLREYRERLDKRIGEQGINQGRLARMLRTVLAIPQRDDWTFGEEEGYIDGRRLAQLISSPAERRLFRLEQYKPLADCAVTFLLDCSGSMKAHIEPVAVLVDILTRALESIGVTTEILGFTTGAWNGGRARNDWLKHRQPPNPGRLNEVCHMVFKDADRSWRRARTDIAALFKADLFREGIDGEAVQWACNRLRARSENRRILIVISDGCPMDGATNQANDVFYLDNHLKQVVAEQEQHGGVEILGLGVGLDLSPFYRRNLAIDLSKSLDNPLFYEIVQLIAGRHRH
ncbi:cobaltochelatase CobT-related protein [Imbroritus primus]|uniref:cobaltochelatase CobT-related protein n=1 Tax=Imbroritus primus TaxID=3058603 RepID=UPI003D1618F7